VSDGCEIFSSCTLDEVCKFYSEEEKKRINEEKKNKIKKKKSKKNEFEGIIIEDNDSEKDILDKGKRKRTLLSKTNQVKTPQKVRKSTKNKNDETSKKVVEENTNVNHTDPFLNSALISNLPSHSFINQT
jgi:adenine-specific DNA glycosylase